MSHSRTDITNAQIHVLYAKNTEEHERATKHYQLLVDKHDVMQKRLLDAVIHGGNAGDVIGDCTDAASNDVQDHPQD